MAATGLDSKPVNIGSERCARTYFGVFTDDPAIIGARIMRPKCPRPASQAKLNGLAASWPQKTFAPPFDRRLPANCAPVK
jgi:hypothetical protein